MGVEELEGETEGVTSILPAVAEVRIEESMIMAFPGRIGMPKLVLIKLMNNSQKTKIMKKRQKIK